MFINDLLESIERRLIVVYPGRFQPFHQGHATVFAELQAKFGRGNVFIATTPQVKIDEKNPFNYSDKVTLMHAAGVTDNFIIQSTQPYDITAITQASGIDPNNTVLIFAVGEPDKDRLGVDQLYTALTPTGRPSRIPPGKKVGDGKPYKTFEKFSDCVTVSQGHAYVTIIPEVQKSISINGQKVDVSHGTALRNLWTQIRNDPNARKEFLTQLYGHAAPELEHIFDKIGGAPEPVAPPRPAKLPKTAKPAGGLVKDVAKKVAKKGIKEDDTSDAWAVKDPNTGNIGIRPPGGMGTWTEPTLVTSLLRDLETVGAKIKAKSASDAEYILYQKYSTVKAKLHALAKYEEFMQRNGKRAIKPGREINLGEQK